MAPKTWPVSPQVNKYCALKLVLTVPEENQTEDDKASPGLGNLALARRVTINISMSNIKIRLKYNKK